MGTVPVVVMPIMDVAIAFATGNYTIDIWQFLFPTLYGMLAHPLFDRSQLKPSFPFLRIQLSIQRHHRHSNGLPDHFAGKQRNSMHVHVHGAADILSDHLILRHRAGQRYEEEHHKNEQHGQTSYSADGIFLGFDSTPPETAQVSSVFLIYSILRIN